LISYFFSFLLLGSSPDVVPLLQRYLDSTGDIQTVSILVLKTIPSEFVHENAVMMSWINRYEINILEFYFGLIISEFVLIFN